jgi:hypothetical protein
VGLLLLA